jgi:dipeptidase E
MKLLLTSGGLANESIAKALFDLVCKKPENTNLVFIPTAANVEEGDKTWFIDDLINLKKQNFRSIDTADISAVPKEIWKPKFESADVLYFEGGNAYHLMDWINKSRLAELLPGFLKNKVYVGSSAGSMVAGKGLPLNISRIVYGDDVDKPKNYQGLGLTDFYFLPHLNCPYFKNREEKLIEKVFREVEDKIYALDDMSALKIIDGKTEVISEGKWMYNN